MACAVYGSAYEIAQGVGENDVGVCLSGPQRAVRVSTSWLSGPYIILRSLRSILKSFADTTMIGTCVWV
ncbi:hypothetical protein SprV_0301145900 [Sparganum proliferum]